jgi:hypothetical protein
MMGLMDRLEPWTRRFQRAPERPAPAARAVVRPPATAKRSSAPGPDAPATRTGRFTRRRLQEQER